MLRSSHPPRSVLVWGARGFIGRHLVPRLLSERCRVTVVSRAPARDAECPWRNDVAWVQFDGARSHRDGLTQALSGVDSVFSLAGASGAVASNRAPADSLDGVCRLQLDLIHACRHARTQPRVVFASSRLVYGRTNADRVAEDHPTAPASMYAAHKLCTEHYHHIAAARGDLTYTILRISNPFGPDPEWEDKPYGVINTMIARALAGDPIHLFGDGSQRRDYLYIPDVVDALWLAASLDEARNGTFNIGRGEGITLLDAATRIRALTGAPPIEFAPWPREYELVETGDYVADISRARRVLGFMPRFDFDAGLRDLIARVRVRRHASRVAAEARVLAAHLAGGHP